MINDRLLKVDINAKDKVGSTALYYAIRTANKYTKSKKGGYNPMVFIALLLDNKAKVNVANNDGDTPLHVAVLITNAKNRLEIVKKLLKAGAHVAAKNKKGMVALHLAVKRKDKPIIKLLRNKLKDQGGKTPIGLAREIERKATGLKKKQEARKIIELLEQ